MFVFESAIGGDEHVALQPLHQGVIFKVLPAEIEKGLDVMVGERLNQTWIDAGVYNDAHVS